MMKIILIGLVCFGVSVMGEECGYPGLPANGDFVGIQPEMEDIFPEGAVVTYQCQESFVLDGISQRTCECNGRWSGSLPLCVEKNSYRLLDRGYYPIDSDENEEGMDFEIPCGKPDFPAKGKAVVIKEKSGDFYAVYSCNDGYHLIGETSRTCGTDGTWNGILPKCISEENDPNSRMTGSPLSSIEMTRNLEMSVEMIRETLGTLGNIWTWMAISLTFIFAIMVAILIVLIRTQQPTKKETGQVPEMV